MHRGAIVINKKYLILLSFAGFIIALDQLTKIYVHTQFQLGESIQIIPGYFDLTYVRNTGAAFGIFRDAQETFRTIFFLSMPPVAVAVILYILHGLPDKERLQVFALSGVFAGAIGNYIDRLRFGYVIDFLDAHWQHKAHWPAFNVADMAIVGGVGLLFIAFYKEAQLEKLAKKTSSPKAPKQKGSRRQHQS